MREIFFCGSCLDEEGEFFYCFDEKCQTAKREDEGEVSRKGTMSRKRTHYDNLKVSRDAPPEVIRAAYKSLSFKFHPDHNPNDANAARIMAIINASYAVLSDPIKRRQYDEKLLRDEDQTQNTEPPRPQQKQDSNPSSKPINKSEFDWGNHLRRFWFLYVLVVFFGYSWIKENIRTPGPPVVTSTTTEPITQDQSALAPPQSPIPPVRPEYIRPVYAPSGEPWPVTSGYIQGYKRLNTRGLSVVTVDNNQNNSDVFVKLVDLTSAQPVAVRVFFIRAHEQFRLMNVRTGIYDIRYRDLDSGVISKSESFKLEETEVTDGIQYSQMRLTLYKVHDGNMKIETISEEEF
jgi:hypothetical protein